MTVTNWLLQELIDEFNNQYPERTVSRTWKDRSAYRNEQLRPGLLTLVYAGERPADPYNSYLKLLVIGRVYCGKDADGVAVEQEELRFIDEWKAFCESAQGAHVQILSVASSHQMDRPDGWFVAECEAGPYDLNHQSDWDEAPNGVFVSRSPEIGEAHQDDYLLMEELSDGA